MDNILPNVTLISPTDKNNSLIENVSLLLVGLLLISSYYYF